MITTEKKTVNVVVGPFKVGTPDDDPVFSVLLWGPPGVGKTTLAAGFTHPELFPAVVLDIELGTSSVAALNTGIKRVTIDDMTKVVNLPQMLKAPPARQHEAFRGVKTVVIDSLSALSDDATSQIAGSSQSDLPGFQFQAGQRDYLWSQGIALSLVTGLIGIEDMVLFATAGEDNRPGQFGPALPPGLKRKVHYRFAMIWKVDIKVNVETGEADYILDTGLSATGWSKTRNPEYRRRLQAESEARWKLKGVKTPGPAQKLKFLLADPFLDSNPPWTVKMDDLYTWFLEETTKKA